MSTDTALATSLPEILTLTSQADQPLTREWYPSAVAVSLAPVTYCDFSGCIYAYAQAPQ